MAIIGNNFSEFNTVTKIPHPFQIDAVAKALDLAGQGESSVISAPVGSGKSLMAAMLARAFVQDYRRVLVLAHRKELIEQNAAEIEGFGVRCGIVSAGLERFDSRCLCTVASVQTLVNRSIDPVDLIVIDEAHRTPWAHKANSQYARVIARHPGAALIGLSGTPFRTSGGEIYGVESWKWFKRLSANIPMLDLMRDGYLCRPVSVPEKSILDDSLLAVSRATGDYTEASMKAARAGDVRWAVLDAVDKMDSRRSIIVFSSDIEACEEIGAILREAGESVAIVHSEMEDSRDEAVISFKACRSRWLVTRDIALEGFNHPATDGIVWLRPTQSPIVWIQGNGRGIRTAEGKENCLVLDYVGNIRRNGAIDDPAYQYAPRICEKCATNNPPSQKHCIGCGAALFQQAANSVREVEEKIEAPLALATSGGLLSDESKKRSWLMVLDMQIRVSRNGKGTIIVEFSAQDEQNRAVRFPVFFSPNSQHSWAKRHAENFLGDVCGGDWKAAGISNERLKVPQRILAAQAKGFWNIREWRFAD